jgi:hypothetical protein
MTPLELLERYFETTGVSEEEKQALLSDAQRIINDVAG